MKKMFSCPLCKKTVKIRFIEYLRHINHGEVIEVKNADNPDESDSIIVKCNECCGIWETDWVESYFKVLKKPSAQELLDLVSIK